uniref:Translocation protein sec63-like protein n=1 Tax=Triatoma infestans TaxID=30076 RepID=A0A170UP46_TRIIF
MGVCHLIDFQVRSEVIDDEASTVYTAGAIVTVTVTLVTKRYENIIW